MNRWRRCSVYHENGCVRNRNNVIKRVKEIREFRKETIE